MNSANDINRTRQNKPGQNSGHENSAEANGVLPLFAAVLNKLQSLGVTCEVANDDVAGALVIRVNGAQVEATPERKRRFVMRQPADASGEGKAVEDGK